MTLIGAKASLVIALDQVLVPDAKSVIVEISFEGVPPEFDMTEFKVEPITCSETDAQWSMQLPPLTNNATDAGPVQIELRASSDDEAQGQIFVLNEDIVVLSDSFATKYSSGLECPTVDELSVELNLLSETLGNNTQTISIPVEIKKPEEATAKEDEVNNDQSQTEDKD